MWGPEEAVNLLVFIVFVFAQFFPSTDSGRDWYNKNRRNITCSPPGWVFRPVWTILYGLLSAVGYLMLGRTHNGTDTQFFLAAYVMYIVNIVLNKLWYPTFFDRGQVGLALWIALGIASTAIVFVVLTALMLQWVSVGLYMPYVLWTAFAVYLNLSWWRNMGKLEDSQPSSTGTGSSMPAPTTRIGKRHKTKSTANARHRPTKTGEWSGDSTMKARRKIEITF